MEVYNLISIIINRSSDMAEIYCYYNIIYENTPSSCMHGKMILKNTLNMHKLEATQFNN
ncbi:hypothetical protein PanWU01x14_249430 [Parasponia andersonii]|uniref:Uncharacterized protein n=1 Tax=Parasponia andersonii TaxID=3476 RepID=A0A2P5BD84_PARAD|nr:hypothetical protein PanWU01x14_249430 [Parasponia andersonii]